MNSLKTVLFPATVIHSIRQYPIFLLFPKITILSVTEAQGLQEESTDTFINSDLCQVDTPCPLGENLARFLQLVGEIQNRKDDYAAQLSSLTLAAMSSTTQSGEESERAIINEFLVPKDLSAEENRKKHEAKLWQARLVLAIGEILDREEEEIAKNLSMADEDTSGLLNALRGDGETEESGQDSPFAELEQITSNFNAVHSGNMDKRLSSWTQLFSESNNTDAQLFVTTSPDVFATLAETYEKESGTNPSSYPGLELPRYIGWSEQEAIAATKSFQLENEQLIADLTTTLTAFAQNGEQPEKAWDDVTKDWNRQLETRFPEAAWGRTGVTVNVFRGRSVNALLKVQDSNKAATNGIVVVIG